MQPTSTPILLPSLRAIAAYAAACALPALPLFERDHPTDPRPRLAIEAAQSFADAPPSTPRTKALRDAAWAALRAAADAKAAHHPAAEHAARAALAAAGAPFLHPLYKSTQIKHILGSAAHAALALHLAAPDTLPEHHLTLARSRFTPTLRTLLRRYPPLPRPSPRAAPISHLLHTLDSSLR